MAQETLEQKLQAAYAEIARLQEVIKKMKRAKAGEFKPLYPGQSRGY
jgi:hypothetical protein